MSKIILFFCLFALFANIFSYSNDNENTKIVDGNNKQVDIFGSRIKRAIQWPCFNFMRYCCYDGCRGFGCVSSACAQCC
uniref:Uncharacterized protein n=1 Tax=Meloidogyne enterolobii TaxID=390850 RepID=A0A6V7THP3_MELEN|nr:unnamed protein product [Meloidogyne enterolobii]